MDQQIIDIFSQIQGELLSSGYSIHRSPMSYETFREVAKRFGAIWHSTEIKVDPQSKWLVHAGTALSLHTDNPYANVVAWYCNTSSSGLDEPTLLVNLCDLYNHMTAADLRHLEEICIPIQNISTYKFTPEPLLKRWQDGFRLNYIDWFTPVIPTAAHEHSLLRFKELLKNKEHNNLISVRLRSGESLFINNNVVLHGRNRLAPTSLRSLSRVWINTNSSQALQAFQCSGSDGEDLL